VSVADDFAELRRALSDLRAEVVEALKRDWWVFAGLWLVTLIAAIVIEVMW
jgi:hypothetical protein